MASFLHVYLLLQIELLFGSSRNFPCFVKASVLLTRSQEPFTFPCFDWVHALPPYCFKILLILFFYLRFGLPSDLPALSMHFSSLLCLPLVAPVSFSWFHNHGYHHENIWREIYIKKLPIIQFSPAFHCILYLWSKYSPQHPVLRYPQFETAHPPTQND